MNKQSSTTNNTSGGFHQLWLVLVELVASGLVITIGLTCNFVVAVLVVCVPLYVLLKKVARQQASPTEVVDTTNRQPYAPQQRPQPTFGRPTSALLAS